MCQLSGTTVLLTADGRAPVQGVSEGLAAGAPVGRGAAAAAGHELQPVDELAAGTFHRRDVLPYARQSLSLSS